MRHSVKSLRSVGVEFHRDSSGGLYAKFYEDQREMLYAEVTRRAHEPLPSKSVTYGQCELCGDQMAHYTGGWCWLCVAGNRQWRKARETVAAIMTESPPVLMCRSEYDFQPRFFAACEADVTMVETLGSEKSETPDGWRLRCAAITEALETIPHDRRFFRERAEAILWQLGVPYECDQDGMPVPVGECR